MQIFSIVVVWHITDKWRFLKLVSLSYVYTAVFKVRLKYTKVFSIDMILQSVSGIQI